MAVHAHTVAVIAHAVMMMMMSDTSEMQKAIFCISINNNY